MKVGVTKIIQLAIVPQAHVASMFAVYETLPLAEATNLLIKTTEASSKGRLSPPSNNKTFLCGSKLVIKSDIVMPLV